MRESISAKSGGPKIGIQMNGLKRETYIHNEPQYGMSIGGINNSGYIDETDFEIAKAAPPSSNSPPENEQEANINNELGTSGDLAQEAISDARQEER